MVSQVSTTKIKALASKILVDAFLDFILSRQTMRHSAESKPHSENFQLI